MDGFKHFIEAEDIFGAHKIVTKHNEVHLSIYFFQSFHKCVRITPVSFNTAERMFADGLPPFVIVWILFDVVIINVHCILVLAAMYDALLTNMFCRHRCGRF